MARHYLRIMILSSIACRCDNDTAALTTSPVQNDRIEKVSDIAPPPGFHRIAHDSGSFTTWLQNIPLKQDNHVYLYNGSPKKDQTVQFAVLDIGVGKKDLQQCADAVMRLRAEYLFAQRKYSMIRFTDNSGRLYAWTGGNDRSGFEKYLENVFAWCGTASLEKQLIKVPNPGDMAPGDVFIKGGYPGHAMIVMDLAVNSEGKKVFMLAQSYMPAQDIHIVRNPGSRELSPWYEITDSAPVITPEWIFQPGQLRTW